MNDREFNGETVDTQAIIQIGLDVLNIMADRFRKEMGREFDNLWKDCLSELEGFPRELFLDISPDKENLDMNIYIMKSRYDGLEGDKDETVIIDAFLELIGKMITSVKKYLGEVLVKEAVQEALRILFMVDKYQQDMVVVEYFIKGLKDSE